MAGPVYSSYPAQNQATGVVVDASEAHVGESSLTAGSSLYTGDVVGTESNGHAQLRVRQSRFELIGESYGAFFPGATGAVAELRHGTMIVALNSTSESFEIFASDVRIVPKAERPILAQITMNSLCDLQIKVEHGSLEATSGKETKTLDEGHAYDVIPEVSVKDQRNPAISPEESGYHRGHEHTTCALAAKLGQKPANAGFSHFKILAGAVAVGILVPVLLHTTGGNPPPESPFTP
ncbi:MAG TPA: hypothetical protein VGH83_08120 [Candidatus Acidoferrum sp.]|jgi:hypothetical protein